MPDWRSECVLRLRSFYPDAEIVSYVAQEYSVMHSIRWRFEMCSRHARTLLVDNDILLDNRLELSQLPGMADEWNCGHMSIMWSGDNPGAFAGENQNSIQRKFKNFEMVKIPISGVHWCMDKKTGGKTMRPENIKGR